MADPSAAEDPGQPVDTSAATASANQAGAEREPEELLRRLAVAEAEADESRRREAALGKAVRDAENELALERASLAAAQAAKATAEARTDHERARAQLAEERLAQLEQSPSWRLTRPLRGAKRIAGRGGG